MPRARVRGPGAGQALPTRGGLHLGSDQLLLDVGSADVCPPDSHNLLPDVADLVGPTASAPVPGPIRASTHTGHFPRHLTFPNADRTTSDRAYREGQRPSARSRSRKDRPDTAVSRGRRKVPGLSIKRDAFAPGACRRDRVNHSFIVSMNNVWTAKARWKQLDNRAGSRRISESERDQTGDITGRRRRLRPIRQNELERTARPGPRPGQRRQELYQWQ